MRRVFVIFCLAGFLISTSAIACDIEDKRKISVGASEGVAGKCSNNAHAIQCINEREGMDSFTCDGPEGSYNGPDLKALIATTCGCGANSEPGASDQLKEELGD